MSLTHPLSVCDGADRPTRVASGSKTSTDAPGCEWCEQHPDRSCPACAARRRRAVRLVVGGGLPVSEAAREMRVSTARVERLLEADADRRCVSQFAGSEVSTERLRQLLLDRRRREPGLTIAALARRMGTSQVQVERWLRLRATAPKTDRRRHTYP